MCLITKQNGPEVAQEDIECVKMLCVFESKNPTFNLKFPFIHFELIHVSPYQRFRYILGEEYNDFFKNGNRRLIQEGFHAFRSKELAEENTNFILPKDQEVVFMKAIIPAGASYYIGENGDIVSNKIIVLDERVDVDTSNWF